MDVATFMAKVLTKHPAFFFFPPFFFFSPLSAGEGSEPRSPAWARPRAPGALRLLGKRLLCGESGGAGGEGLRAAPAPRRGWGGRGSVAAKLPAEFTTDAEGTLLNGGLGNLCFSTSNASLFCVFFFSDVFTSCEQWEKWTNFLGEWTFHWLKYVPFLCRSEPKRW